MNDNINESKKNIIITLMCQIFSILLSFFSRSVFIYFLSTEYLGISGLFSNILTILSFTELGIGNVMIYNLYEPIKNKNNNKIKTYLNFYRKAYLCIAFVIFFIGCAINPFIYIFIKDVPSISEDIHLLFFLYLLNTVASYLFTYKKSLLLADQKSYVVNIVFSVTHFFSILFQTVVLFLFHSFIGYLVCQLLTTLITNLIISYIVNNKYKDVINEQGEKLDHFEIKKLFSNVKALSISKISGIISTGTDNIIISKMFGLSYVGLISNYNMLINSVNNVFYSSLSSITASIGNFNVDSSVNEKRELFDELFLFVYLVYSFISICILVLTQPFIVLWLGENYLVSFFVLFNLVLGIYVSGMNYSVYSFRTTMGYFKEVQYVYVLCAFSNVVLSIILGKCLGIAGIFMATWISKFLLTEIADGYYTYGVILGKNIFDYLKKYLKYFTLFMANFLVCFFVTNLIKGNGWAWFAFKAVVCAITCVIFNYIFVFNKIEFKNMISHLKVAKKKGNHD